MRRVPDLRTIHRLAAVPPTEQFTSAISLGELIFGATRRGRADLITRIEQIAEVLPVLPFDDASARVFGRLKAELEQAGTPLAEPDLRIAAIAISASLTLVTGNSRHFARGPGLSIENWFA
jgi:tRNA(fMet)-specific endonuclease VapC